MAIKKIILTQVQKYNSLSSYANNSTIDYKEHSLNDSLGLIKAPDIFLPLKWFRNHYTH